MDHPVDRAARFHEIAEDVFEPLQRYLFRRVPRQDAEDLLSDVLLTVWRRIDDAPPDGALPWCYGIARRTLANHRRAGRRGLRLVERLGSERLPHHPDPADLQGDPDLQEAMSDLNAGDREVLRLWAWEQLEPREIALVLGVTQNAATLRLSRARRRLGQSLERQVDRAAGHREVTGTEEHRDDR